MAMAASASPAAFGAKTPGPAPSHASASFPRPSPRASAPGRVHFNSLHLGGASATGNSSVVGNASGIHLAAPVLAPLAVPKMFGAVGGHKSVLLFHCEEMRELAEQMVARNDDIELRSISWRTFADGFPNLFISNAHKIRVRHVAFLASFSSLSVIFEQLSTIYALPKLFILSFTLILPFFPTGTSERMEDEGDVATTFTLARILSNIPI